MNVQIITIGDEILIGQIIDTNSAWMAQQLNLIGAEIKEIVSVSDTEAAILKGLDSAKSADVILLTGGLGPTKDDITKKVLADYFGTKLEFHEPTWKRIEGMFKKWDRDTTPAHRQQCFMPANAKILFNKMGTAPGMWFEHNGKVYVSMPGVPYEMKYLMEYEVLPKLGAKFPGRPIAHRTILTVGEGESRIARRIENIEENLPAHIKLAFLPGLGQVRLRLSGIGEEIGEETGEGATTLNAELDKKVAEIQLAIPELIFGYDDDKLEAALGRMLVEKRKTLGTAESCTGGFLAHRITSISGSSAYYQGSIIAYADAVKINQLKVKEETLKTHGAVSEQTVIEMVKGTINLLGTDIAIATSGIAGPGGGSEEKPVGTIWLAVGDKNKVKTKLIRAGKSRVKNIEYSSVYALSLLREFLLDMK